MNALYDLHHILDGRNAEVAEDLRIAEEEIGARRRSSRPARVLARVGAELERLDVNELLTAPSSSCRSTCGQRRAVTSELGPIRPASPSETPCAQIALNLITNASRRCPRAAT